MKRKKQPYIVELSKRAKILGWMFSFGLVLAVFGICWISIAISMNHNIGIIVGLVVSGIGLSSAIPATRSYSKEYNKCVANSLYTTILWNGEQTKYIIVQNGHGDIIEINNVPVVQTFQTSGRYIEKMGAEVKT